MHSIIFIFLLTAQALLINQLGDRIFRIAQMLANSRSSTNHYLHQREEFIKGGAAIRWLDNQLKPQVINTRKAMLEQYQISETYQPFNLDTDSMLHNMHRFNCLQFARGTNEGIPQHIQIASPCNARHLALDNTAVIGNVITEELSLSGTILVIGDLKTINLYVKPDTHLIVLGSITARRLEETPMDTDFSLCAKDRSITVASLTSTTNLEQLAVKIPILFINSGNNPSKLQSFETKMSALFNPGCELPLSILKKPMGDKRIAIGTN